MWKTEKILKNLSFYSVLIVPLWNLHTIYMNWVRKKNCVLNFWFFEFLIFWFLAARGVENHKFGQGGYRKNPRKWSKIQKSKNQNTGFFQIYVSILCKNFTMLLSKLNEKIDFEIFSKLLFRVQFYRKSKIIGPRNLKNPCTNVCNGSKWLYLWVIYEFKSK